MRTIAVFQAIQGHYGEAERFIRRSLEISEKTLGSKHPEVAASRKVFTQVLRTVHRGIEAHRPESQAQDIRTRSVCGNRADVNETCGIHERFPAGVLVEERRRFRCG